MQKNTKSQKQGPKITGALPFPLQSILERSTAEQVCCHLLLALAAALFGSAELIFGVRPFGIALVSVAPILLLPAFSGGIAIYCLLFSDYMTLGALLLALGLRVSAALLLPDGGGKEGIFRERPLYRITAATLSLFLVGILTVVRRGFLFYDLFGVILAVSAAPVAAFLYLGAFEKQKNDFPHARELGLAALLLTAVFAMRSFSVFGIYPAAVVAASAAFLLTSHRGLATGAVGGLLAGLCFDFRLAPAFLLCGISFSLLEKSSRGGGVLAGSAAASAYAFFILKSSGILLLLPSLLTAGAIFLAFDSAGLVEGAPTRHLMQARRRAAQQSASAAESKAKEARLSEVSEALLSLSGTFFEVSSRLRRPGREDLRTLCDKTFDSFCEKCPNKPTCWEAGYRETATAVSNIAARLYRHGSVGKAHVGDTLAAHCKELPAILAALNNGTALLTDEVLRGDKTAVIATDYAAFSRIITESLESAGRDFACDSALGERIATALLRLGYQLESAAVCGENHRLILLRGVRLRGRSIKVREIRATLEKICRFPLSSPECTVHEGVTDLIFREKEAFASHFVKLTRPKSRGEGAHCGDSVTAFEGNGGVDFAFICDGMGSGNGAALTSALASLFLSRLLGAGGRADSALRMLNGFLSARGKRESESSTTVDLLEIDRVHGKATLYKCGAAPTYLLRRGEITRFFSRTAPVGILEALDAERIQFEVKAGDVLLQVSDGFTDGEEDAPWLSEMLRTTWDGDADAFARRALNRATSKTNDDLSIIITEIKEATEGSAEQSA